MKCNYQNVAPAKYVESSIFVLRWNTNQFLELIVQISK